MKVTLSLFGPDEPLTSYGNPLWLLLEERSNPVEVNVSDSVRWRRLSLRKLQLAEFLCNASQKLLAGVELGKITSDGFELLHYLRQK